MRKKCDWCSYCIWSNTSSLLIFKERLAIFDWVTLLDLPLFDSFGFDDQNYCWAKIEISEFIASWKGRLICDVDSAHIQGSDHNHCQKTFFPFTEDWNPSIFFVFASSTNDCCFIHWVAFSRYCDLLDYRKIRRCMKSVIVSRCQVNDDLIQFVAWILF